MSLVAITGHCVTTTTLALAAAWPRAESPLVVEADPKGGSLAGWFDVPLTPSLSSMVAAAHGDRSATLAGLADLVRTTPSGLAFVPAPFRRREAARAVLEAWNAVLPALAADAGTVVLADVGRPWAGIAAADELRSADLVVVTHRQDPCSARAEAANLERLRELVGELHGAAPGRPIVLAIIGATPFDPDDIANDVAAGVGREVPWSELAVDPLAAATLAGRQGVSARRMSRLPLSRTVAGLADIVLRALLAEGLVSEPTHPSHADASDER